MRTVTMHIWILTVALSIGVFGTATQGAALPPESEMTTINVDGGFPDELLVSVYMKDTPVHLRLKRSTTVEPDVPLFVICNGTMFEKNSTGDMVVGYYQDIDTGASLEVSCPNSTEDCTPSLRGSFYRDRLLFELSTVGDSDTLPVPGRQKRTADRHQLLQRTDADGNEISDVPQGVSVSVAAVSGHGRAKRSGYKTPRCVELVAVISYDLFQRWFRRSPRFSRWAKERDALFNIRRYFAMVIHGVDLRYSSILSVDFSLCVRLAAFVIATTPGDSPWTEQKVFAEAVDGASVLPFFRDWAILNGGKVGDYDHIQLFTGYDVTTAADKKAVGLSYMASICLQAWAVSIVEDSHDIVKTTTAATHELGHSLGAYHDGHMNVCPSTSKYIMSPTIGRPSDIHQLNPWKFSQCSISYFSKTIRILKKYGIDCLRDKPRLLDPRDWEIYTKQLPGQIYTPDQQCRLMHGETSFMSRKLLQEREVSNLCTGMWCHTRGSHFTFHIPARGTSCGDKKWCIDGSCVYDAKAPKLDDACPYGDYHAPVFRPNWTCDRLMEKHDYLCNMDYQGMQTKCCAGCAPVLARSRGKRAALHPMPSEEEIERRLFKGMPRNVRGNIEVDSLENVFKYQPRRVSGRTEGETALTTGYSGYLLSRTTSVRLGEVVIDDLPTSA